MGGIAGAIPFEVGKTVAIALCIPGLVITLAAKRPAPGEPEVPEVPRATVVTQKAEDPEIGRHVPGTQKVSVYLSA